MHTGQDGARALPWRQLAHAARRPQSASTKHVYPPVRVERKPCEIAVCCVNQQAQSLELKGKRTEPRRASTLENSADLRCVRAYHKRAPIPTPSPAIAGPVPAAPHARCSLAYLACLAAAAVREGWWARARLALRARVRTWGIFVTHAPPRIPKPRDCKARINTRRSCFPGKAQGERALTGWGTARADSRTLLTNSLTTSGGGIFPPSTEVAHVLTRSRYEAMVAKGLHATGRGLCLWSVRTRVWESVEGRQSRAVSWPSSAVCGIEQCDSGACLRLVTQCGRCVATLCCVLQPYLNITRLSQLKKVEMRNMGGEYVRARWTKG